MLYLSSVMYYVWSDAGINKPTVPLGVQKYTIMYSAWFLIVINDYSTDLCSMLLNVILDLFIYLPL